MYAGSGLLHSVQLQSLFVRLSSAFSAVPVILMHDSPNNTRAYLEGVFSSPPAV